MTRLFTYKIILSSLAIAAIYIVLTIYLMNFRLVKNTLLGSYPLNYKSALLLDLLGGMWTSMTLGGLLLLIVNAVLTGLNASFLVSSLKTLKAQGKIRLVIGSSSLFGIVGSGCASCGLPVLALLGLGGSFSFLPMRGKEISYISIVILLVSLYLLIKTKKQGTCEIKNMKKS